jgi:hypothetical protein
VHRGLADACNKKRNPCGSVSEGTRADGRIYLGDFEGIGPPASQLRTAPSIKTAAASRLPSDQELLRRLDRTDWFDRKVRHQAQLAARTRTFRLENRSCSRKYRRLLE